MAMIRSERQRAKGSSTSVKQLRRALGTNAPLLDNIPLDAIVMVEHGFQLQNFLPDGIRLATIRDRSGTTAVVHALMRDVPQTESLPEIWTYAKDAGRPNGSKNYPMAQVVNEGELMNEFKMFENNPQRLVALLKACFILKKAEMPDDIAFSKAFLTELRAACRKYETTVVCNYATLEQDESWGIGPTLTDTPAKITPFQVVRKGLLVNKMPQTNERPMKPLVQSMEGCTVKVEPSTRVPTMNPYQLGYRGPERETLGANLHNGHISNLAQSYKSPFLGRSQYGLQDASSRATAPQRSSTTVARDIMSATRRLATPNISGDREPLEGIVKKPLRLQRSLTAETLDRLVPVDASTSRVSVAQNLDEFLKLRDEQERLDAEILSIGTQMKKVDTEHIECLKADAKHIDKVLKAKHESEKEALYAAQKAEANAMKYDHAELKARFADERMKLKEKYKAKCQVRERLKQQEASMRNLCTRVQLPYHTVGPDARVPKRKRSKTDQMDD